MTDQPKKHIVFTCVKCKSKFYAWIPAYEHQCKCKGKMAESLEE